VGDRIADKEQIDISLFQPFIDRVMVWAPPLVSPLRRYDGGVVLAFGRLESKLLLAGTPDENGTGQERNDNGCYHSSHLFSPFSLHIY
jgi:hypothetical protein